MCVFYVFLQRTSESDLQDFDPIVSFAGEKFPELIIPWLKQSGKDHSDGWKFEKNDNAEDIMEVVDEKEAIAGRPSEESHSDSSASDNDSDNTNKPDPYRHLYIYKSGKTDVQEEAQFISFVKTERIPETGKDVQHRPKSFISANLGKIKGNMQRKTGFLKNIKS